MVDCRFIKNVEFVVTAISASGCRCTFPCTDEYGKFEQYRPHDNWEVWEQDHDNPNFAHYLQCMGCGYQLAKQYWRDSDHRFTDYLLPEPTFINLTLYHIKKAYLYYFNVEVDEFPKTVPYNDVLEYLCKTVGILELSKFKKQYSDDNIEGTPWMFANDNAGNVASDRFDETNVNEDMKMFTIGRVPRGSKFSEAEATNDYQHRNKEVK